MASPQITRHHAAEQPIHPGLLNVQMGPRFLNEKRPGELFSNF